MINEMSLVSKKLDTIIRESEIDMKNYDHWVIDVQGAEMEVLEGSKQNLKFCNSLFIEVSKGEVYLKGSQWNEVKNFLMGFNLIPINEIQSEHENVLFVRKINRN